MPQRSSSSFARQPCLRVDQKQSPFAAFQRSCTPPQKPEAPPCSTRPSAALSLPLPWRQIPHRRRCAAAGVHGGQRTGELSGGKQGLHRRAEAGQPADLQHALGHFDPLQHVHHSPRSGPTSSNSTSASTTAPSPSRGATAATRGSWRCA